MACFNLMTSYSLASANLINTVQEVEVLIEENPSGFWESSMTKLDGGLHVFCKLIFLIP